MKYGGIIKNLDLAQSQSFTKIWKELGAPSVSRQNPSCKEEDRILKV